MYILKNLNIEAKRSKLMLNCESSEAKRTCSIVKKLFRSEANMFILKNLNSEAKGRKLTLTCESSEAKRTYLFLKIKLAKRSELVDIKN
jgi:hypothetical protein